MDSLYSALDEFLSIKTWASRHPYDQERFFDALEKIVGSPGFTAEALGSYIDTAKSLGPHSDKYFRDARDNYVRDAHAIKGYLDYVGKT